MTNFFNKLKIGLEHFNYNKSKLKKDLTPVFKNLKT